MFVKIFVKMSSIFDAIHHKIVLKKQRIAAHFGEDVS